jgi:hypothetical protein
MSAAQKNQPFDNRYSYSCSLSLFHKYISKAIVATNGTENEHSNTVFLPPKNSNVGRANPNVGITGYFLISSSDNRNIPWAVSVEYASQIFPGRSNSLSPPA